MFLGPPRPCHNLLIPKSPTTPFCKHLVPSISATAKSPQSDGATATHQVGDLGRSLLTTLQSNSRAVNSVPEHQEQNRKTQEEEDEESQITGSDILWALQKASARRKKKQKKRAASSGGSSRQEGPVDYSNVRPLNVKKAWGSKLDALEKRLQELSETI